jgi:hypothetical protein
MENFKSTLVGLGVLVPLLTALALWPRGTFLAFWGIFAVGLLLAVALLIGTRIREDFL